jgi:hypothetical protein
MVTLSSLNGDVSGAPARSTRLRPAEAVRLACRRWGEAEVARRCAGLLCSGPSDEDDVALLGYLAAAPSLAAPVHGTWPQWHPVWAARGLRYAWDPEAAPAVVAALAAPEWRVREMAAHVCRVRELGEAAEPLAPLLDDPVPRVRAAVARALAVVGEAEHAAPLRRLLTDDDPQCRARASQALRALARRLDRDLGPDQH